MLLTSLGIPRRQGIRHLRKYSLAVPSTRRASWPLPCPAPSLSQHPQGVLASALPSSQSTPAPAGQPGLAPPQLPAHPAPAGHPGFAPVQLPAHLQVGLLNRRVLKQGLQHAQIQGAFPNLGSMTPREQSRWRIVEVQDSHGQLRGAVYSRGGCRYLGGVKALGSGCW